MDLRFQTHEQGSPYPLIDAGERVKDPGEGRCSLSVRTGLEEKVEGCNKGGQLTIEYRSFGRGPALAPSKHNKGLTGEECACPRPEPVLRATGVRLSGGL